VHQKCALKFDFLLCLEVHLPAWGVHLHFSPINYAEIFFSALRVHVHPVHPKATPMTQVLKFTYSGNDECMHFVTISFLGV